jgi:hypothetical protein
MKFYVATKLERAEDQKAIVTWLKNLGHEITYDWSVHGSVQSEGLDRIREVAMNESRGVLDADLVIVILPGGRGTHAELGMALADADRQHERRGMTAVGGEKRVVIIGDDGGVDGRTCAFYHHPRIDRRFSTVPEFQAFMEGVACGAHQWP